MKIYLSGPISGLPAEQVKKRFSQQQKYLKGLGFKVVTPLKNGCSDSDSWTTHMIEDIKMLMPCDAIYLMMGWQYSVGSSIEHDIALRMKKVILFEDPSIVVAESYVARLLTSILAVTKLNYYDLLKKDRTKINVYARAILILQLKSKNMTDEKIAKVVKRSRVTVYYLNNKYKDELIYNHEFRELYKAVETTLVELNK